MQNNQPIKAGSRVLVGATEYLGAKVLRELEQNDALKICAVSRRERKSAPGGHVEWVKGDMMSRSSLDAAMEDVDVVVTSANSCGKESIEADFEGNKNLIDVAKKAGVSSMSCSQLLPMNTQTKFRISTQRRLPMTF